MPDEQQAVPPAQVGAPAQAVPPAQVGAPAELGAQPAELGAQPAQAPEPAVVAGINQASLTAYNVNKKDLFASNLTAPAGTTVCITAGVVKVDLTGMGLTEINVFVENGGYRMVAHDTTMIVTLKDQVRLLRHPYIKEVPDSNLTIAIS